MVSTDKTLWSNDLVLVGARRLQGTGDWVTRHYAGTGAPVLDVRLGSRADLEEAVDCANAAFPIWRSMTPAARRDILLRASKLLVERCDQIAPLGSLDAGIPIQTVRGFVHHAAEWLSYYAGWIDKASGALVPTASEAFQYVRHEPYGVVGVISPSNSTVSAMVLGPLLAAGNCAVIKSSEFTSNVTMAFMQVFLDAGLPPGVLNVVPGGAEVGEALVRHPNVHKIHFTGSCQVGREVGSLAASLLKPAGMELGGKSANIVFADADLDVAADITMRALVRQSGQSCVAGTRIIAHASIIDTLLEKTIERTRMQRIGDPLDPATVIGPVVNRAARDRILGLIETARVQKEGRVALGDEPLPPNLQQGYYVAPTILANVENTSMIAQTEIFGPVITFIRFEKEEQAVDLANATPYGLAAYVHTRNLSLAHRTAADLDVGILWINGAAGVLPGGPFGGNKASGYGRIGGRAGLYEFSKTKNVWLNLEG